MFTSGFYDALKKIEANPIAKSIITIIDTTGDKARKKKKFKLMSTTTTKFGEFKDMKKKFDGAEFGGKGIAKIGIVQPDGHFKTQEIKIGKLINAMVSGFSSTDIEKFVRALNIVIKTEKGTGLSSGTIKVVKGPEISYYYLESNYAYPGKKGDLGNSCMKNKHCQLFMNFYAKFPDTIKLVVKVDGDNKVLSRAVLWTLRDKKLYLDRIYSATAGDADDILVWAKQNKIKDTYMRGREDQEVELPADIIHMEMPYLDTFKYGYLKGTKIILVEDWDLIENGVECYTFQDTGGKVVKIQKGMNGRELDEEGYDANGYNQDGFNRKGFNYYGFDTDGFDVDGFDVDGLDRNGEEEE